MASVAFAPDPLAGSIAAALQVTDIESLELWSDLDALSTHTHIEGVEVPIEGVVVKPEGHFTAIMNLYVTLQYGRDDLEGFTTSDSFLAKISGRLEDGVVEIDNATVDTTAFYS